jgi:PAS domain S-box-containing protein
MNNSDDKPINLTIRQKAEALLREKLTIESMMEDADFPKILHELRVHQIELELQNDELHRAQRDLEIAQKKYFNLFNFAPVGYLILDEQGRILEANVTASKMLDYARSTLNLREKKTPFLTRLAPDSRPVFRNQLVEVFTARQYLQGELVLQTLDGRETPVQIEYSIVEHYGDSSCLVTLTDISQLKQTETSLAAQAEALRKSNIELERFAYTVSHDLREPVRTINSFGQLLINKCSDQLDADGNDFVGFIADAAQRLDQQIKDLLEFSRVGRQQTPFQIAECQSIVQKAIQNLQASIEEKNAKITVDELPTVNGQPAQLSLLFQNLIANAIKFNDKDTAIIHLSARERGTGWLFSVADNGIGIEAEFTEQIFQVFRRLHARDKYPGTGIGLAICERVVEQHGGKIWIESQPGEGSTVYFTIPKTTASSANRLIGNP